MGKIKKGLILLILLSFVFVWSGCSNTKVQDSGSQIPSVTKYPITITDDVGNKVTIEKEPVKIVSTAPSCTEILFALGLGSKVVGRSQYDNYPKEVKDITAVGGFSGPNTELITKLAPEVLFTVKGSVNDEQKKLLESAGIKVVIFNPSNIDGVFSNIKTTGEICNVQSKAKELTDSMQAKRQEIISKVKNAKPKKVFIDLGSFYSVGKGSFIDSMLKELNAENIADETNGEWPQLTLEQVINSDPEVYISLYSSIKDLKGIAGLSSVAAFKNGSVKVIDYGTADNDIVQRPGPRIIEGLEIYAKTIYPELYK